VCYSRQSTIASAYLLPSLGYLSVKCEVRFDFVDVQQSTSDPMTTLSFTLQHANLVVII
jgi:hypothetical protein